MEAGQGVVMRLGNLELRTESFQVKVGSTLIPFSRREFDLLHVLAKRPGVVMSADEIGAQLHNLGSGVEPGNVRVLVFRVRQKLAGSDTYQIHSIRGRGYGLLTND
jgi:DNA-binding response OmpR family regulator